MKSRISGFLFALYFIILTCFPLYGYGQSNGSEESFETQQLLQSNQQMWINSNRESGFYEEGFELILDCTQDAKIYYTMDGTTPDKNSKEYTHPIMIKDRSFEPNQYSSIEDSTVIKHMYHIPSVEEYVPKGTIIRAKAWGCEGNHSDELVLVFFVGLENKYHPSIPTINILVSADDMFGMERGIYVAGKIWEEIKDSYDESLIFAPANFTQEVCFGLLMKNM